MLLPHRQEEIYKARPNFIVLVFDVELLAFGQCEIAAAFVMPAQQFEGFIQIGVTFPVLQLRHFIKAYPLCKRFVASDFDDTPLSGNSVDVCHNVSNDLCSLSRS